MERPAPREGRRQQPTGSTKLDPEILSQPGTG